MVERGSKENAVKCGVRKGQIFTETLDEVELAWLDPDEWINADEATNEVDPVGRNALRTTTDVEYQASKLGEVREQGGISSSTNREVCLRIGVVGDDSVPLKLVPEGPPILYITVGRRHRSHVVYSVVMSVLPAALGAERLPVASDGKVSLADGTNDKIVNRHAARLLALPVAVGRDAVKGVWRPARRGGASSSCAASVLLRASVREALGGRRVPVASGRSLDRSALRRVVQTTHRKRDE